MEGALDHLLSKDMNCALVLFSLEEVLWGLSQLGERLLCTQWRSCLILGSIGERSPSNAH